MNFFGLRISPENFLYICALINPRFNPHMADVKTIEFIYYEHLGVLVPDGEKRLVDGVCYSVNFFERDSSPFLFSRILKNGKIMPRDTLIVTGSTYLQCVRSITMVPVWIRTDADVKFYIDRYDEEAMDIIERIRISETEKEWVTVK